MSMNEYYEPFHIISYNVCQNFHHTHTYTLKRHCKNVWMVFLISFQALYLGLLLEQKLTNQIVVYSFSLQKRKPGVLSETVMVEWILANQIDSSIYYGIQHSLHDWNGTPVHFLLLLLLLVCYTLYIITIYALKAGIENLLYQIVMWESAKARLFSLVILILLERMQGVRKIEHQSSPYKKRSFKICVHFGYTLIGNFQPLLEALRIKIVSSFIYITITNNIFHLSSFLLVLTFSVFFSFSASSHSLYWVYFSSNFCVDFHLPQNGIRNGMVLSLSLSRDV